MHTRNVRQSGFTIVELLIATAVFSVIMVVISVSVLQFSRQYYKGVIANSTQDVTRTIVDDITRSVQFNGGGIYSISGSGNKGYCVGGSKRYSYVLNQQVLDAPNALGIHQARHGLVADTNNGCNSSTAPLDIKNIGSLTTQNARELLGQRMRIVKFTINPSATGDLYEINVRVVYGDDDLLCSPSTTNPLNGKNDCSDDSSRAGVNAGATDLTCRGSIGSQYCAVSELSTTVKMRVGH